MTQGQPGTDVADPHDRGHLFQSPTAMALVLLAGSILTSTALLLGAAVFTWHWADQHLAPPRLATTQQTTVNRTELLHEVQAFQLVTIEQTYAARTQQSINQTLTLGASRTTLPAWLDGEQLTVQGQAQVLAGVDLAQVRPEDLAVQENGRSRTVEITIPAAQIVSTELVPNTLQVSMSTGLLPQMEQALGVRDDQLRTRSADLLIQAGRQAAEQQGIEASAATEAQRRLTGFLQSLPASGGPVTYRVIVKPRTA